MKSKCPCHGCEKRLVGCHTLCREYGAWRKEYERQIAENRVETPRFSRAMLKYIYREMMRR